MAVKVPNGSIISIASGYATAINHASGTNANPCVLTTSAQTYASGDFLEVTSGWSRLTDKIVRLSAATSTSATLEGIDTSSTTVYNGTSNAVGSTRKITGWTQLLQVLETGSSGGEQQFLEYQFLESDASRRIPTTKSAAGLTLRIADDPALAGYILSSTANDDRLQRAVRIVLPNNAVILYNAYISLNKTPSLAVNELMSVEITLSLLAEVVRYAS